MISFDDAIICLLDSLCITMATVDLFTSYSSQQESHQVCDGQKNNR